MDSLNLTSLIKKVAVLVAVTGVTSLISLPVLAQLNPHPSIFNEPPYHRSYSQRPGPRLKHRRGHKRQLSAQGPRQPAPPNGAPPARGSQRSAPPDGAPPARGSQRSAPPDGAPPARGSHRSAPPDGAVPARGSHRSAPPDGAVPG